jgi:hypothetical protein
MRQEDDFGVELLELFSAASASFAVPSFESDCWYVDMSWSPSGRNMPFIVVPSLPVEAMRWSLSDPRDRVVRPRDRSSVTPATFDRHGLH